MHSDSRWFGEQFPEFGGVPIEDVSAVGVYVDRTTTSSGSNSGSDSALCTPHLPTRGPNRGHIFSPPNDPERTVRRSIAAVMQGPSLRVTYWISSIAATNGALAAKAATMLSTRSTRNNVTPAPSAPGIARTANAATSASNSGNPRLPATKPARSPIPACNSASSALTCSDVRVLFPVCGEIHHRWHLRSSSCREPDTHTDHQP